MSNPITQHSVFQEHREEIPAIIAKMYGNPPSPPKDEAEAIFAGIARKYANIRKALRETAQLKNRSGSHQYPGLLETLEKSEDWRKDKAATPPYISTCDEFADVREHIHRGKAIQVAGDMPIDEVLLLMEGGY